MRLQPASDYKCRRKQNRSHFQESAGTTPNATETRTIARLDEISSGEDTDHAKMR